ncbi:MAG: DUF58 domain-containing protein [Planctomycetota bacterium]|nr:DUF58 domain-containing protein [Planctomycetota bacterium]
MAQPATTLSTLDPRVLDRLSSLSLVARTVVEGFRAGQHRSPHKGSSIEFAQHRQYVPGDEMRHVDWKIFARSNRLVVKEFVEETNFSCHLLLDASGSMAFSSIGWSKFDYARWCAAALGYLVISQRDSAGLVLFDEDVRNKVAPKSGMAQQADIVRALEGAQPNGATRVGDVLMWLGTRLSRRGIVAIFSDFFDDVGKIVEAMTRLTHAGHEPILFQILDPQELEFDYGRLLRLDGLEESGRIRVDPKAIRQAYKEEIRQHQTDLQHHARVLGVDFVPITTSTSLDVALSTYLARRTARARARG